MIYLEDQAIPRQVTRLAHAPGMSYLPMGQPGPMVLIDPQRFGGEDDDSDLPWRILKAGIAIGVIALVLTRKRR